MEPRQSGKSPPTGFFDLPPEIRNQIYALLITASPIIDLQRKLVENVWLSSRTMRRRKTKKVVASPKDRRPLREPLRLVLVSQKLREEFAPVFFGTHTFCFRFTSDAINWTRQIGTSLVYIRSIWVDEWYTGSERPYRSAADMKSWFAVMGEASCLQVLVVPSVYDYMGPVPSPRRLARTLSKLVLPFCHKVLDRWRAKDSAVDPVSVLRVLQYPEKNVGGLEYEVRAKSRLESMMRTPEERIQFEKEVLQDIRHLFITSDTNNATHEQS